MAEPRREPRSASLLASARLSRIIAWSVGAALLWVVLISALGIWRHNYVTQRQVNVLSEDALVMARSNAWVLEQRFETLTSIALILSNQEHLGRVAATFNALAAGLPEDAVSRTPDSEELLAISREFASMTRELQIDGIYLTDESGFVIAASDWDLESTHLFDSFGDAAQFGEAIETGLGRQFGVDTISGQPRFLFSARVDHGGRMQGLVVLATSSGRIMPLLRRNDEDVLLSDDLGIVVASNNKDWMYRAVAGANPDGTGTVSLGLRYGRSKFLPLPEYVEAEDAGSVIRSGRVHASITKGNLVSHVVLPADGLRELRRFNVIIMVGLVLFGLLLVAVVTLALAQIAATRERAVRDPLTGLYNRRYVDETLPGIIELDERGRISGLAAVAFDLDRFKGVNDTWGHETGDRVLRRLARILADCSRRTDILCRMGGEEFVAFLIGENLEGAALFAERVRERVAAIDDMAPIPAGRITTSAGVVMRRPGESLDPMVSRADELLYLAKSNGRNRIEREETDSSDARPADAEG